MRGFAPCTNDVPYLGERRGRGGQRGDVSGVMDRVEGGGIDSIGVGRKVFVVSPLNSPLIDW